jgi:hypothetical protein
MSEEARLAVVAAASMGAGFVLCGLCLLAVRYPTESEAVATVVLAVVAVASLALAWAT